MKVKVKDLGKSEVEMEVELEAQSFDNFMKRALVSLGKEIEISGFRKGKAPSEMIRSKIGQANLLSEAARLAIDGSYKRAVLEQGLEPISQPRVEILKLAPQNPFCFKAVFLVLPKIELPDYKKIASSLKKEEVSISQADIDKALDWLQKSRPKLKEVSRPARKGDFVEIEFSSPQVEKGSKQKQAFILGKGHLVKGFEPELEGMEAGAKKEFSLNFPLDFGRRELAGKKVDFRAGLDSVKEVEFLEINDDFAKGLGKFETLTDLKKSIKQGLKEEKEMAESKKRREEILEKIAKACKFEVPLVLIENEKQKRFEELKQRVLKGLNLSFEDYLKKIKKTEKELLGFLEKEAENQARRFLILREIAKEEMIGVSDDEIGERVNQALSSYPDLEKAQKGVDLDGLRSYTEERLRNEKVFQLLEGLVQS